MARLGQQEQADLCSVRARGDVDQIVFRIDVKGIAVRKAEEGLVYLLEVPRIAELDRMQIDGGLRRDGGHVLAHAFGQ